MTESKRWLLRLPVLGILIALVTPFPDGPPLSACTNFQPGTQVGTTGLEGHTSLPMNYQPGRQSQHGPYYVKVHEYVDHYLPDTDYHVSIVANQTISLNYYTGILLQARKVICAGSTIVRVEDEPLGTFTIPSSTSPPSTSEPLLTTMDCNEISRSALAHRSRQLKTNETVIWHSPPDIDGQIVFRMTIVKAATEYWTEQNSEIMLDSSGLKPRTCGATDIRFALSLLFLSSMVHYIF